MKKLVTMFLLGVIIAGMAFIGEAQEKPFAGQTIRVLSVADPYPKKLVELLPEFEAETGIKVELDLLGYGPTYQKMNLDFLNDVSSYHAVSIDAPWEGEVIVGKRVMPLDDLIAKTGAEALELDDLTTAAKERCVHDGTWYFLPQGLHGEMLAYRIDLFEEAGIKPPQTPEELVEAAKHFHVDKDGDGTIDQYGIAFNGQRGAAFGQELMVMMYAFGSPIYDENMHPVLDTPETRAALEYLIELTKYAPPDILNMAWDERVRSFTQQKSAMTFIWMGRANAVQDSEQSNVVGKIGYTAIPGVRDPFIVQGGYTWGIPANIDPEKIDPTWEFIKWDVKSDTKRKMVQMKGGPYFERYSILADPELQKIQPELAVFDKWKDNITAKARPATPEYSLLQDTLGIIGHLALSGEITVEEATKQIQEEMDKIMRKAGYY